MAPRNVKAEHQGNEIHEGDWNVNCQSLENIVSCKDNQRFCKRSICDCNITITGEVYTQISSSEVHLLEWTCCQRRRISKCSTELKFNLNNTQHCIVVLLVSTRCRPLNQLTKGKQFRKMTNLKLN